MTMQLTGVKELKAKLGKISGPELTLAIERGLYLAAEEIMTASKQIVPLDLGTLRGSGHVKPPVSMGGHTEVELGYGGAASAYAIIQHERTDFRHTGGRQAKYLERPLLDAIPQMSAILGRPIKTHLSRA